MISVRHEHDGPFRLTLERIINKFAAFSVCRYNAAPDTDYIIIADPGAALTICTAWFNLLVEQHSIASVIKCLIRRVSAGERVGCAAIRAD